MKCTYCNFEQEEAFAFCPQCGAPTEQEAPRENHVAKRLMPAVKSGKFLAICILLSVSLGCTLFAGSMDLLTLLAMIFMWQIYANGHKNVLNAGQLRCVSGTVYAAYVLNYVAAGFVILSAITVIGAMATVGADGLMENLDSLPISISLSPLLALLLATPIVLVLFLLVFSAGYVLFNFFGLGSIHAFIKSTYQNLGTGDLLGIKRTKLAYVWLWIFGIFTAIDAVSSFFNFELWAAFAGGSLATVYILAAILVKQISAPQNEQ